MASMAMGGKPLGSKKMSCRTDLRNIAQGCEEFDQGEEECVNDNTNDACEWLLKLSLSSKCNTSENLQELVSLSAPQKNPQCLYYGYRQDPCFSHRLDRDQPARRTLLVPPTRHPGAKHQRTPTKPMVASSHSFAQANKRMKRAAKGLSLPSPRIPRQHSLERIQQLGTPRARRRDTRKYIPKTLFQKQAFSDQQLDCIFEQLNK
eukprot:m.22587 g.22587  ORF g.22587 m.22587 type:complete len:205 (-) comp7415_c0_seq1:135-749(-)